MLTPKTIDIGGHQPQTRPVSVATDYYFGSFLVWHFDTNGFQNIPFEKKSCLLFTFRFGTNLPSNQAISSITKQFYIAKRSFG